MKLYDLMINSEWCILPEKLNEILRVVEAKTIGELNDLEAKLSLADAGQTESKYTVNNGVAVIKIYGTLAKRMNIVAALSGGTSYEMAGKDFKKALADPHVETIVLKIDSPGGNIDGLMTFATLLYESRDKKKIISYVNGLAASAACLIATAGSEVVLSDESAQSGSLGIIAVHREESKKHEKEGIKYTVFASGKYKKSGNKYESMSENDKSDFQQKLDYLYGIMIRDVARNRGVTTDIADEKMGQGRLFIGQQAVDVRLADRIENWDNLLARLKGRSSNKLASTRRAESKGGYNMSKIQNFDLKSLAESITEAADLPELKVIEDACLLHFAEKAKSSENWIEEEKVKGTGRKVTELIDLRRRQILAAPEIKKTQEEYALGQAIGRA
jgi:signal peptide peptidase SppA